MNIITTRTAPRGARYSPPSTDRLAAIDTMISRAASFGGAFGGGGRMTATDPAPAEPPPNSPPDTATRLDAVDAQLLDHEGRIAALEERSPPPPPVDNDAQRAPPPSSAAAAAPIAAMVDSTAIYARMNARPTSPKAPATTTTTTTTAAAVPGSVMIQTAHGPILNARAIHDRNNAAAAARAQSRRG